jgi:hypothetical protein
MMCWHSSNIDRIERDSGVHQNDQGKTTMMPASLLAEAIRNQETIQSTRERLAAHAHVATHYRAIGLPALAAASALAKKPAQKRNNTLSTARIVAMLDR